ATAYLTEAMVRDIVKSGILPDGALQLVAGAGRGLLDQVMYQDVITFTGSASTGLQLKAHPQVIREAIPFNLEADSLNGTILGEDAVPGTPEFDLFIKEVRKEMTIKCGQRCTAIRRILIPENLTEAVQDALTTALQQTTIGDPMREGVRMGALISMDQVAEVRERIVQITQSASIVYGNPLEVNVLDADPSKGAFMSPILLRADDPWNKVSVHEVEAFGPVSSLIPYRNLEEALLLVRMGKGSLVASMTTYDDTLARRFVMGAAAHHGRILVLNRDCAKESTGHGSPLPTLVHGGPGRAGGGEEMGGKRGVLHYLHRTAIQGSPTTITRITEVFQRGSKVKHDEIHPFRRYFEELQIGEQWITAKHTVTETDIVNFANVSGDHFYAHVDETSLEGTLFERRVAHGYYLLAKAAGLFVDPRKGPVLLNYGIDECRFTKPVYPGNTIGVKITVKEKIAQEKKDETDVAKGIVKWDVEVYDEANEPVALAVVLTMVKKRNQD
ncbi:MAG TPA: phenylacetic acid degradation bifunctional protein PaaZ, partial [Saprospiraceae bacterium]|nr:phenylacetic acid degradation bifunctional protein PaaZ [Saprospiraceae bacterium]